MNKMALGKRGEEFACTYLEKNGYKILERNYRIRAGEIDIIAFKKGHTCFVEVKTRNSDAFGSPAEAVNYRKQQAIIAAANHYAASNPDLNANYTFDIAEVTMQNGILSINYIENAFC